MWTGKSARDSPHLNIKVFFSLTFFMGYNSPVMVVTFQSRGFRIAALRLEFRVNPIDGVLDLSVCWGTRKKKVPRTALCTRDGYFGLTFGSHRVTTGTAYVWLQEPELKLQGMGNVNVVACPGDEYRAAFYHTACIVAHFKSSMGSTP